MARKKTRKQKQRILKKFGRGGFSKKEIKKVAKRFGVTKRKATNLTTRYTKRNQAKKNTSRFKTPAGTLPSVSNAFKNLSSKKPAWRPPMVLPSPGTPPASTNPFAPDAGSPFYRPPVPATTTPATTTPDDSSSSAVPSTPAGEAGLIDALKAIGSKIDQSIPDADPKKQIEGWEKAYNTASDLYQKNISDLTTTIDGYKTSLGKMSTDLATLGKKYRDRESAAAQFKAGDTKFVRGGSAGGVRLKRSRAFQSGDYAQGTSRLNRRNRMKAKGVNL
tara:strand:+ start:720 stop:1547 length:828 start_codon:yes stop_codon:yes gene_type:complete